ncbi:hypothetical protein [Sulfurimonas sp.]
MKKLLLATLFIGVSVMAMSSRAHEPIEVISGDSLGKYSKPGAPVEIEYTTQHVNVGDVCSVKATLLTAVRSGSMNITLKPDSRLNQLSAIPQKLSVDLSTVNGVYPLNFAVSADSDGLYYIKLLVQVEGRGMRAFSIPVYVGDAKSFQKVSKSLQRDVSGKAIIVSPAVETIK